MDLRTTPPATTDPAAPDEAPSRTDRAVAPTDGRAHPAAHCEAEGQRGARADGEDGLALLDEHALRELVHTQPVIEQAKGLLMGCYRLDPDQAFALLSRWSSHRHVKIRDLAAQLVNAAARPGPAPFHPAQTLPHARPDDH